MERKFTFKKRPIETVPPPVPFSPAPTVNRPQVLTNVSNYQPSAPSKLHLAHNPGFKRIEPVKNVTSPPPPPPPKPPQPVQVHSLFQKKPQVFNQSSPYARNDDEDDYGFRKQAPPPVQPPVPKVKQQFQPLYPSSAGKAPVRSPPPASAHPGELKKSLENQYSRLDTGYGAQKYSLLSSLQEAESTAPAQKRTLLHADVELAKSIMALKSTNIDLSRMSTGGDESFGNQRSFNDDESAAISYSPQTTQSSKKASSSTPSVAHQKSKLTNKQGNLVASKVSTAPDNQSQEEDDFISSLLNDEGDDDFVRFKPTTTTPPKSGPSAEESSSRSSSSPVLLRAKKPETKRKELVIVDSDSDGGGDIIIEEDEDELMTKFNSSTTGSKNRLHQPKPGFKETAPAPGFSGPKAVSSFSRFGTVAADDDDDAIDEIDVEVYRNTNRMLGRTASTSNMTATTTGASSSTNRLFALNTTISSSSSKKSTLENPFGVYIPDLNTYEKNTWLFNDIKDCSPYYHQISYPHSNEMLRAFRERFGLKAFRPQQFEAVNASLLGNNCFILMPTGGGKSLCYQLPATLTPGVTFVVSPLKSLIIDQVQKLNALNIPACHLLSSENESTCDTVYQDLCRREPVYKLVYVTPEKLNQTQRLMQILTNLYARNMMARLVIDEAHCVSTWGHDFRKDYTQMGALRDRLFPRVPVMLLTATATPRVRKDILVQMGLSCDDSFFANESASNQQASPSVSKFAKRNYINADMAGQRQKCAFFIQSFNRENLIYQVEPKTSNAAALEKIESIIKAKFNNKSGIIYCISRNECESVSEYLRKKQIKAMAYHAGMDDKDRATIQHKWSNGIECRVVCATIAFGMGIDKADVRYVIHLGLPKSLEGYYQESGRAGRDGNVSTCILFFNNGDRTKWLRLMEKEAKGQSYEVYKVHLDNLYRMSQYCDNRTDCRRTQILEYFGQVFDRQLCINSPMKTICDNCKSLQANEFKLVDITQESAIICRGVQRLSTKEDVTLLLLSDVLKGSKNSKVVEKGYDQLEMHGKLSKFKKSDIERIIRRLIFAGYLKEDVKILTHSDTVATYIRSGPKVSQLVSPRPGQSLPKIELDFRAEDHSSQSDTAGEKQATSKKELAESSAGGPIIQRCKADLLALAKQICLDKGVKNMSSVFSNKMLAEMLIQMPQTREALLRITYYTEAIYDNYEGEKFLEIFQTYGMLLDECRAEEERQRLEKAAIAAAQAAEAKRQAKLDKMVGGAKTTSLASRKHTKTYGLLDDDDIVDDESSSSYANNNHNNIDYDFDRAEFMQQQSEKPEWLKSKGKRSFGGGGGAWKNAKKSRTNSDFSSSPQTSGSSSYFAGKSSRSRFGGGKAKSTWKFKKFSKK